MAEGKNAGEKGPQSARVKRSETSGATSIVRLAGKDVNGSLNIQRSLGKVKGVGSNMAHAVSLVVESKLGIPQSTELGSLSEDQIEKIEAVLKDPISYGIPWYLINRNKDMETGKSIHLVSNDLVFSTRQDVSRDMTLGTWRGFRHQYGQKVRGQHTRSTGRTGATVGVTKKAAAAAAKPGGPAKTDRKEEKPAVKK